MESHASFHSARTTWAKSLTLLGILIAVANMGLGWKIIAESRPSKLSQLDTALSSTPVHKHSATPNDVRDAVRLVARVHEANVDAVWRAASYQHAITTVGLAFSFGLLATGFALFVMGIESAFGFRGEHRDVGTLSLKATSPGILCFVLAAVLIAITLLRPHELAVPDLKLPAELLHIGGGQTSG